MDKNRKWKGKIIKYTICYCLLPTSRQQTQNGFDIKALRWLKILPKLLSCISVCNKIYTKERQKKKERLRHKKNATLNDKKKIQNDREKKEKKQSAK